MMKRVIKIIVPILFAVLVVGSIGWYLFEYDTQFTKDLLVSQARHQESQGNHELAAWFYNLAYRHAGNDEAVAIELAQQYKSTGNYTKAEFTLSNAIADGGTAELYLALCRTYVEQDKLLDAVTMLDNITDPVIKAELDALRPPMPAANPAPGYHNQYITVSVEAPAGTLYVSSEGEYPSIADTPYSGPIQLSGGETTLYALAVGDDGLVSPLAVLGYTVGGVIEEVTLKDPAIDASIRQQLGVTADHVLYTNELWTITSLVLNEEVADYSDLSWLPFLNTLAIRNGSFENLNSLSSLTLLQELHIYNSSLTADDLATIAALPKLNTLTITGCGISSISPLEKMTGLVYLDLHNNTIGDISVIAGMKELVNLNLNHNALTDLTALSGLTKLDTLDISYNSVASILPLASCSALSVLDISGNQLTTLEGVGSLINLTYLAAAHNQLVSVEHAAVCPKLGAIDISNNSLTDISALSALTGIVSLNFSHNQVAALPAFSADSPLVMIDGSHNAITSLEPLGGLASLNMVTMDYNSELSSVAPLVDCPTLIQVSVYGTAVTEVSMLTDMSVIVHYNPT